MNERERGSNIQNESRDQPNKIGLEGQIGLEINTGEIQLLCLHNILLRYQCTIVLIPFMSTLCRNVSVNREWVLIC